ncbi:MAG: vWA domain-containing protein [Polyangiales bacterium]
MNHRSLLLSISLLASLPGCGAQLFANKGSVSVTAQGDARMVGAGAAVGALALAAAEGSANAAVDAQSATATGATAAVTPGVAASSGGAAVSASGGATAQVVVAQITGLRVHAAGQGAVQTITGGAIAIERREGISVSNVVSGDLEIEAGAVEGSPCNVSGGEIHLASGATLRIGGGRVTLARGASGWIVSSGRITTTETTTTTTTIATGTNATAGAAQAGAAGGAGAGASVANAGGSSASVTTTTRTEVRTTRVTHVEVERIAADGGNQVIAGGEITVTGVPGAQGLAVVDGAVEFDDADLRPAAGARGARVTVRATARRTIHVRAGGMVVVSDRHGRRWRARVEAGELTARTEGTNPSGRVVWEPTGGELRVTVVATGGESLTLDSAALPEATVALTPRQRGALDALIGAVPSGSREAERLAAAVEVVIRNAESAEPAFYAIPVRGRSLVLMVDVSYSMSDPDPQGSWFASRPSKLDVARAELVKVLASVPRGVRVDVVAFSSNVSTLWTATREMDDASLAEAVRWVAALQPRDETHPLEAMEAATSLHPDQIVMLSDGRPSDSEAVLRSLIARVDAIATTTRVDVVGFGADQDRQFLGTLAAHGHGTLRLR